MKQCLDQATIKNQAWKKLLVKNLNGENCNLECLPEEKGIREENIDLCCIHIIIQKLQQRNPNGDMKFFL